MHQMHLYSPQQWLTVNLAANGMGLMAQLGQLNQQWVWQYVMSGPGRKDTYMA